MRNIEADEERRKDGIDMVLYKRKWPCAVCGSILIYDSQTHELKCDCCTIRLSVKPLDLATNFLKLANLEKEVKA